MGCEFATCEQLMAAATLPMNNVISIGAFWQANKDAIDKKAQEDKINLKTINFITEAYPGDIVFFDNEEGHIIHVGILLGNNKIIHASGKVRIDTIDHEGIYNVDAKKYTHKLRLVKKMI